MRLLILLLLISLFSCVTPKMESLKKPIDNEGATSKEIDTFPDSWSGIWNGDLNIYSKNKLTRTLPMSLSIFPKGDSVQWTIQYDTMDTRPYTLKMLDKEKGIYLVDEHNSILLEAYLFGNKLISQYDVMGNRITVLEEKKGSEMIFEIVMSKTNAVSTTGNTTQNGEEIPEVISYPVLIYQKAVLRRE